MMKAFFRWIARVVGSALTLGLAIVLLPYASDLVYRLMPDVTSSAHRTAAIISTRMTETARLESIHVTEEGTVDHDLNLIGVSVGGVTFDYTYEASFGIDLSQVQMIVTGKKIVFLLPKPELILDSLTPTNISRRDTLVYISDDDYEALKERELLICRERFLSGERSHEIWDSAVRAMQQTIEAWIINMDDRLQFEYALLQEQAVI